MNHDIPHSEIEADAAAARQDFGAARQLLQRAVAEMPGRLEGWMKLAAMCRAAGDVDAALEAVSGALRADPYDFVARLLKANLLEKTGAAERAREAYGEALAQRPDPIPPHLVSMVAHAEAQYALFISDTQRRLADATVDVVSRATPAEAARIARFGTNIARVTKPYHSEPTHFHYPGLIEREFHDREDFSWLETLEAATDAIAQEFEAVVNAERAELVPYIQYSEDLPLRQWKALNKSRDWTAIHLLQNGHRIEANAAHCPRTMEAIAAIPQPRIRDRTPNAMFSLLAPGTRIPPHVGVANIRLVCHLPLIVPDGCWFRVGAETRKWKRGEAWVFDDTIEHEAANDGEKLRVILIVDCWHPGLSPTEQEAVAAAMSASDVGLGKSI
ncbi:aspartyl/asparaginyl beta-hydroxylase domain-containing protein [Sphingosinicella humi]|uniref:aspartyl/asparaginyl beta-hydroxylase domain-containing protein n=1 Tax=Allosphingosinicella humi TaxID=2068657 RepID=UPI001FB0B481|nr:aspartyl/asparaginyl beta-hydroxylase domain-containing protein [Sphingosinicella humi]